MSHHDFLVGTFNTPQLYTLRFTPPSSPSHPGSLTILHTSSAIGSHSWLHLNPPRQDGTRTLYATAWTDPPSVVAYAVNSPTQISLLGSAETNSRSGYVCASDKAVYSAGGATGEVFSIDPETGNFTSPSPSSQQSTTGSTATQPLQNLSFIDTQQQRDDGSTMDFGGLRHGAHSADLSPDNKALYIADIGRNCIWTYSVSSTDGTLTLGEKFISPRPNDGPRHVHPHPSGKYVYSLQEHTSIVDVFATSNAGVNLTHVQGVRIIPPDEHESDYWADEVRTCLSNGDKPQYLYASTRGLTPGKKGFVAVYKLREDGTVDTSVTSHPEIGKGNELYAGLLCMYQTPTSGGWANAIQPGPTIDGIEYLALTDSEEGYVFVLSWDGSHIKEVARARLDEGASTATAVWL
ncbi:Lactonase, 7-bladed beta-propeller-domain-containing protein [Exophiala viscosa]|uniref:Lactonase, 7-bladed beta-propeller-domain-containing protein n=1 Tax=Exophiala viscosa TaxID=2486360 RepID=A0AAN6DQC8_9EURO|nr:Lactonase, 7-bladed beta-propeller-domain-containing protein [Exophiala viscosa]KAI1620571.1 Lactonase, 7-bladed beta-propeller-domain-containing protein [Exophiala viscosa]